MDNSQVSAISPNDSSDLIGPEDLIRGQDSETPTTSMKNCNNIIEGYTYSYELQVDNENECLSSSRSNETSSITENLDSLILTSNIQDSENIGTCDHTISSKSIGENSIASATTSSSTSAKYFPNKNTMPLPPTEIKRRKKVNIFVKDTGPKWHNVVGNTVTEPFVPSSVQEAFKHLPVFGRAKNKESLNDFYNEKIREFVGGDLSDEEYAKLSEFCSPKHLMTGKEIFFPNKVPCPGKVPEINSFPPRTDEMDTEESYGSDLCIAKKFKMRMEKDVRNQYMVRLKYRGVRLTPIMLEDNIEEAENPEETLLEPGKDTLIRIRFYRPFSNSQKEKTQRCRHSVMSRDVVVPGRLPLSTLRDRIACANDLDLRVDVSARPGDPPHACAKELFPSGFMFINNVFYVDGRAGCRDTSAVVRAWAAGKGLGSFVTRDMGAALDRTRLKLGHPEVYVHQGNCEHLFTLVEVRLVSANDALRLSSYPAHVAVSQNHTIYCTSCAEFGAKWIVTGSDRVPFDPAFFCDTCFRLYLYKDGKKIGNFNAYSYMGNELNMLKAT